jgi:hypothetical protein
MQIHFDNLVRSFRSAVVSLLKGGKSIFGPIRRSRDGTLPITALHLGIYPWHGYVALSFRDTEEIGNDDVASWRRFEIIRSDRDTESSLSACAKSMTIFYESASRYRLKRVDAAHLLFLAGAQALLHKSVYGALREHHIELDDFSRLDSGHFFEFLVFDPDATIRGNYCEIIRANVATRRLLSKTV